MSLPTVSPEKRPTEKRPNLRRDYDKCCWVSMLEYALDIETDEAKKFEYRVTNLIQYCYGDVPVNLPEMMTTANYDDYICLMVNDFVGPGILDGTLHLFDRSFTYYELLEAVEKHTGLNPNTHDNFPKGKMYRRIMDATYAMLWEGYIPDGGQPLALLLTKASKRLGEWNSMTKTFTDFAGVTPTVPMIDTLRHLEQRFEIGRIQHDPDYKENDGISFRSPLALEVQRLERKTLEYPLDPWISEEPIICKLIRVNNDGKKTNELKHAWNRNEEAKFKTTYA